MDPNSSYRLAVRVGAYVKISAQLQEGQGREGTNQPQKENLKGEPHDAQDADSLDIWQKHAINMYMILMPHHLLLQC
ncbi:hypothetical protein PAHAL_7G351500 [Panicum hallii]|jgi:hypothetical protein|uniref:Uncharacterized protein n=1 Tax=Panicum hallii TaxID=206008 RepID=A0A2T8IEK6_9POAL|nr:hypothetical protein PAHAL_7G351500 [Panicum hallii]